ncbi:PepSY domain-containing protein [Agromyces sp. Marseille-Q5079]|uniref:PepSY domain-containing protein n=1 Tax=Agromyces sp. Marseille-Q5079 TaxID=3439059 RepID=UPI003D9C9450
MSETTNTPNLPDPKRADAATPDHSTTENLSTTPATSAPAASASTSPAPSTSTPAKPTSRKRKALIAGGSVLAALLLAGGGIAVGAAVADENDDDRDEASATSVSDQDDADEADDRDEDDVNAGSAIAADRGTTSADELNEIVETAASEADGTAVGVDANADGSWDVEFRTEAGDETEVRVASDGTAKLISTEAADADDADDAAPQGALDSATVRALVTAALGEVDGRIVDLDVNDDTTSPYDVSVLTGDGRTVDVSLDADFTVVATGADD